MHDAHHQYWLKLISLIAFLSLLGLVNPTFAETVPFDAAGDKHAPDLALPVPSSTDKTHLSGQALEAAKLLGIETQVNRYIELKNGGKLQSPDSLDKESLKLQLSIVRKVMTAALDLRSASAKLDKEIVVERQAAERLTRKRDGAEALTNNANFLQLNILSMVIDGPLEQSHTSRIVLYGNRLNIVSGITVGGLAGLAFLEQRGGVRGTPAPTNLLGQSLGLDAPADEKLPPLLWTYLNSVPPSSVHGLTRREQLLEYWKTTKVLPINITKPATIEQVSAFGPRHHWWCESIKFINSRVTMLFDLRAIVDLLNSGLVELLQQID